MDVDVPHPSPHRHRPPGRTAFLGAVVALALAAITVPAQAAEAGGTSAAGQTPRTSTGTSPSIGAVQAAQTRARKTGKPVAIPSLDNATQSAQANPDGSYTVTTTAQPSRVFKSGQWVPIDTTLKANPDGTVSPAATGTDLDLSGGGTEPLASMNSAGQHLSVGWPTALPHPTLSGATATYPQVLPGVDLAVTANADGGFSDVLVVKDAQAAANPALAQLRLSLSAPGLSVASDAAGNITATNPAGQPVFVSPTPFMWDSSTAAAGAGAAAPRETGTSSVRGAGVHARTARIAVHVSGNGLTLTPDKSLLSAKTTQYPLYLDPSWSSWTAANPGFVEVQQGCASSEDYDSTTYEPNGEGVGDNTWSGCIGLERTYYQFALNSKIFGTDIDTATLKTDELYSASCSASSNVAVYEASSTIGSGTTWNYKPGLGSSALDTQSVGSACTSNPSIGFSVLSAVSADAAASKGTLTLALVGDESDGDDFRRFSTNPTVVVQYDTRPKVASAYTSPGTSCDATSQPPFSTIGNTAITLKAEVTDPDAGATLTASFTYSKYGGSQLGSYTTTGTFASGGVPPWTIGALPSGNYTWTVKTSDGITSSASTTCHFTVDATAPNPPVVASSVFPTTDQGAADPVRNSGGIDDFTFTPDGDTDVASYAYSWGGDPASVSPQQTITAVAGINPTPVTLTPPGLGLNKLYVYAVDHSGNISTTAEEDFFTLSSGLVTPADGDFNDDGIPDVMAVGTSANPGLWLYEGGTDASGAFDGTAAAPVQEGSEGTVSGKGSAADWTGALITHGEFTGDAASDQDLFVRTPDGAATIYSGDGEPADGSFSPDNGNTTDVTLMTGSTDWLNDQQIVAAGQLLPPNDPTGGAWIYPNLSEGVGPDLWAVQGDELGYYAATYTLGIYMPFTVISSSGWTGWTIIDAGDVNDLPALWARNNSTGELDLWTSNDPTIAAGSTGSTKTVVATKGFATTDYSTLASADDTGPGGCPQLWGVAASTKELTFIACTPASHTWTLGQGSGTTAPDTPGAQSTEADAALNGAATWADDATRGEVLSLDGTTGYAATTGPAVDTSKSYTVSAWVKLNSLTTSSTFVSQSDDPANGVVNGLQLYYSTAKKEWAFDRSNADSDADPSAFTPVYGGTPATGVWTQLTGVYDADAKQLRLYINGTLANTAVYGGTSWNADGPVQIGRSLSNGAYGDYANGQISDVTIYPAALPAGAAFGAPFSMGTTTAQSAVHSWSLSEGTGTTALDAPAAQSTEMDAPLNGAATWADDATRGEVLSLNGTTAYAATTGPAVDTSKSYTVSAWVKLNSLTSNSTVVSQSDNPADPQVNGLQLYYSSSADAWAFDRSNSDADASAFTPAYGGTPATGVWTQLTGVYDTATSTMNLYVNGALAASAPYNGTAWNATGPVQIGRRLSDGTYGDYANGEISDVHIYNTALPPDNLATLDLGNALAQID